MKSKLDTRHEARRLALTGLFAWLFSDFHHEDTMQLSREFIDSETTNTKLAEEIIQGTRRFKKEIDEIIQECAPEWPIDKISKIDLIILRIAIYEILYREDTPAKVAIDEAVELAKEFGNDTSSKFINGVLGTVVERQAEKE